MQGNANADSNAEGLSLVARAVLVRRRVVRLARIRSLAWGHEQGPLRLAECGAISASCVANADFKKQACVSPGARRISCAGDYIGRKSGWHCARRDRYTCAWTIGIFRYASNLSRHSPPPPDCDSRWACVFRRIL